MLGTAVVYFRSEMECTSGEMMMVMVIMMEMVMVMMEMVMVMSISSRSSQIVNIYIIFMLVTVF